MGLRRQGSIGGSARVGTAAGVETDPSGVGRRRHRLAGYGPLPETFSSGSSSGVSPRMWQAQQVDPGGRGHGAGSTEGERYRGKVREPSSVPVCSVDHGGAGPAATRYLRGGGHRMA